MTDQIPPLSNSMQFQPRDYQVEMLQESLQRNIIVAMDTGSGKTKIAVMRIAEEMTRAKPGMLAWFLCPSVALAHQQYRVIKQQLPALQSLILIGDDGVDLWSTQDMWNSVLENMSIVVSTFQVLLDALRHGFVTMVRLALIVIDEAHHCTGKHPLNRIMQNFYHETKLRGQRVPAILGLTASPIIRSKAKDLEDIERNLDAISRSPKLNREELLRHVHRPDMIPVIYSAVNFDSVQANFAMNLRRAYELLDIAQDPYVRHLIKYESDDAHKLEGAFGKKHTFCQQQLRSLLSNAEELCTELGVWACNLFLSSCLDKLKDERRKTIQLQGSSVLRQEEISYLVKVFEGARITDSRPPTTDFQNTSAKAQKLLNILEEEWHSRFSAIVFVKTRQTVKYLAMLLASDSRTSEILKIGKFVGLSGGASKGGSLFASVEKSDQTDSLEGLRTGAKNIIICTSVCEEGIDISACNMVICFEKPHNLKSFIQRRGRARARGSKYMIMFEQTDRAIANDWNELERQMREMYTDDMRRLDELKEEERETAFRMFSVDSTGAKVTLEDATQRLWHFCNTLPASSFSTAIPLFKIEGFDRHFTCVLHLPNSLDASIRCFTTSRAWRTERLAKCDAAFEAFVGLYKAGLLNDNLVPNPVELPETDFSFAAVKTAEHLVDVRQQLDPFKLVARLPYTDTPVHRWKVSGTSDQASISPMFMEFQFDVESIAPLTLFVDRTEYLLMQFEHIIEKPQYSAELELAQKVTKALLRSLYQSRMKESWSFSPVSFLPELEWHELEAWAASATKLSSTQPLLDDQIAGEKSKKILVRQRGAVGRPAIFLGVEEQLVRTDRDREDMELLPCLKVQRLPGRTDFLHPASENSVETEAKTTYLPASSCVVDEMPLQYVHFARLIPSIMHHVGRAILVTEVCNTILAPIGFRNKSIVQEALTTSGARESSNYQRLEFLGDAILGLCTSITLMAEYPRWHEGYLTRGRSFIVSNSRLARACQDSGLSDFIMTTAFTGARWTPPCIQGILQKVAEDGGRGLATRQISIKTLADVVEALIGAASIDRGMDAVFTTLTLFIPSLSWGSLEDSIRAIHSRVIPEIGLPPHFTALEGLIGHHFNSPALLVEALNHGSHVSQSPISSYERLEFGGDSILSFLVTRVIFDHEPELPVSEMHLLRTASVNADFLAFLSMSLTVQLKRNVPVAPEKPDKSLENDGYSTKETYEEVSIHDFMFHIPSFSFATAQAASIERFHKHRSTIGTALTTGNRYPWALLAAYAPEKFFSDIIESVLCAIYFDTGGDMAACDAFLEHLGVLPFLRRAMQDGIATLQPKQELGIKAVQEKVSYVMVDLDDTVRRELDWPDETDLLTHFCRVFVGDEYICTASGLSRFAAETLAADKALERISQDRSGSPKQRRRKREADEQESGQMD